jgi:hypothetical protein
MYDPFWDVRDHAACEYRIDYGDHTRAGCDPWDPCVACRAAKARARAHRDCAHRDYCDTWLAGMRAREQRVLQVRREMGWSAAAS